MVAMPNAQLVAAQAVPLLPSLIAAAGNNARVERRSTVQAEARTHECERVIEKWCTLFRRAANDESRDVVGLRLAAGEIARSGEQ